MKTRDLRDAFTTAPPLLALAQGSDAHADRVLATHAQADSVLGDGRRVLARVGLHAASAFQTPSTDPASPDQTHPLSTAVRTVARTPPVRLTPGHYLRFSALIDPSGMTQKYVAEPGSWVPDHAAGLISVSVRWVGPAAQTIVTSIDLPVSELEWAKEQTSDGGGWSKMSRVELPLLCPNGGADDVDVLRAWCDGAITAEVAVAYRGGVRVIDAVVQEVPFGYARDLALDTVFAAVLATNDAGQTLPSYLPDFPLEASSDGDPTLGSLLLADVTARHQHALGPVLMHWTAFDEGSTPVTALDVPTVSTDSFDFVDLVHQAITEWRPNSPGWSVSSGGHAQQFITSNGLRELRDLDACAPVRCWAYCYVTGGATAQLRFQTAAYSVASLTFASATPAWRSCTGHLRTGLGPEDPSVLALLGRIVSGAGAELHVSQLLIEYADLENP